MNKAWYTESQFYHIYPLGLCGAPEHNDLSLPPVSRIKELHEWIPHLKNLGITALYLGPINQSETHGYDTIDYLKVDRRLGTSIDIKVLIDQFHTNGIKVILDGVFNHTGRQFFAFQDLLKNRETSQYKEWFMDVNFHGNNDYNDGFSYLDWNGCQNLVKLNLTNRDVKNHILSAVKQWIEEWDIDGLRLDAADVMDLKFLKELSGFTRSIKDDFYMLGEVIHGDYRTWIQQGNLDAVTNYETYKGLYSSCNDKNFFEIAYSLNRQFNRDNGIYKDLHLYSFTDNHDVNRLASQLNNPAHLYLVYLLMYTMPGAPSLYYGSEWGQTGEREPHSDHPLRPRISTETLHEEENNDLVKELKRFSRIRNDNPALKHGSYRQIDVQSETLAFLRETDKQHLLILINGADDEKNVSLKLPYTYSSAEDLLNNGECYEVRNQRITTRIFPNWGSVLKLYP